MKTEKHIDWEEVYKYQREHPLYKKEKVIPTHKRRWKKKPSTCIKRLLMIELFSKRGVYESLCLRDGLKGSIPQSRLLQFI